MADPTISLRPQKTVSGFVSKWNAAGGLLPVQYEIDNTKWPTNSEDTTYTISSVSDSNGYASVTLSASASGIVDNSWVEITGTTNYNGVYRVRDSVSGTVKVLDTPYIANDSGSLQQYYNNYVTHIEVYAGIDSGHPHASEDPIGLIGTIEQKPDSDNTTYVDISKYVQRKLSSNNERDAGAGWPNDLNLWTDFYIIVYESYEKVRGTTITGSDVDDSSNVLHAVYAALPFKNTYAGNMYNYIVTDDVNGPQAKFLTQFETLTYFLGAAGFDVSIISEIDTFDLLIEQYDQSGNLLITNTLSYSGDGRGVYRFDITDIDFEADTKYLLINVEDAYNVLSEVKRINYDTSICVDVTEAPINLTATLEGTSARLNWIDKSIDEDTFEIFRSLSVTGTFTKIAQVGENIQTYLDTSVSAGNTYYYKVRAIGKDGTKSAFTNVASVTIPIVFEATFNTANTEAGSSGSDELILPIVSTNEITIDWGDGSSLETIPNPSVVTVSHNYSSQGSYTVEISTNSDFSFFYNNDATNDKLKITNIINWGGLDIQTSNVFHGCSNLTVTASNSPAISSTSLSECFKNCTSLTNISASSWDVSSVTNFLRMFDNTSFDDSSVNGWDVSSGTQFGQMFRNTPFNQDIGSWDVSSGNNFFQMFKDSNFNQDIGSWDVSSGTNFSEMFHDTPFDQDISGWDVSSGTLFYQMFRRSNFNQDISSWDVSSGTQFYGMFDDTPFDQDIGSWDVSSGTLFYQMFKDSDFNQDISSWDVSGATSFFQMFKDSPFNQDIGSWTVSSCTGFHEMFMNTPFNQDIGSWNVSSGTRFNNMFDNTPFDQDIGSWNVSSGTLFYQMFRNSDFNQDISSWDVSSGTLLYGMFENTPFDQNIGSWDVSSNTNFSRMFQDTPFNQDISGWDVSSGTSFLAMFQDNTSFNQSIGSWTTTNMEDIEAMFLRATAFDQDLGGWDVTNVTDALNFAANVTLSTSNYDAILIGWEAQSVQNNVTISFGSSKYTSGGAAETARTDLINDHSWTITDGGPV